MLGIPVHDGTAPMVLNVGSDRGRHLGGADVREWVVLRMQHQQIQADDQSEYGGRGARSSLPDDSSTGSTAPLSPSGIRAVVVAEGQHWRCFLHAEMRATFSGERNPVSHATIGIVINGRSHRL